MKDQDGGETSGFRKFKIPPTSPDQDEPLNWSKKTLRVVLGDAGVFPAGEAQGTRQQGHC